MVSIAWRTKTVKTMKAILTLLAVAATTVATTATLVEPVAAQWGSYGLSQQQLRQQRGNGWSSGDYFGAPQQPRIQQPYGGGYTPGLQHNTRYRQGSCATYLNC
jgi:opacity protein-like surface antigen